MAHLHLLLATNSPAAILIKHGPGRVSCTVGWDRKQDTFQMGQCLRQRLECPDISPDGRYFSYYVHRRDPEKQHQVYRGISRSPWLKALTFWSTNSGSYPGVSIFLPHSSRFPKIYGGTNRIKPEWDMLRVQVEPECPPEWKSAEEHGIQVMKWLRDGWTIASLWARSQPGETGKILGWAANSSARRLTLEKRLPHGWRLQMTRWLGSHNDPNRGVAFETFALISEENGIHQMPDWVSADFDAPRNRVVWTADNMLYAAPLKSTGLEKANVLWDGQELKFMPIKAPY